MTDEPREGAPGAEAGDGGAAKTMRLPLSDDRLRTRRSSSPCAEKGCPHVALPGLTPITKDSGLKTNPDYA